MKFRHAWVHVLLLTFVSGSTSVQADPPVSFERVGRDFDVSTRPLLKRYCLTCHSTDEQEGDLDLERFETLRAVRSDARAWQKVAEMLDNGEMPPKKAKQLAKDERSRLRNWVRDYLDTEAKAQAGDPGRVVLRRLSNAEYTYTLRDLTGLETLDPAREFPADGAAGEGFTNTGNALVMSPALVTRYLDAAKAVASHAVLLPNGFRFSTGTTSRDWTEETLTKIRAFYREFTDASGGDKVNLQGIVFDTNQGGRLPLEKYLAATIEERDALTQNRKSIETVAREHGLNAKYLGILWRDLTDSNASLLVKRLAQHWRVARPSDVPALVAEITAWQKGLWTFSTVGHIGKVGGPKAWLEPVTPLIAKQEIRFKIPPSSNSKDVTISLVALDAGDGDEHDVVVWQEPRIVAPGRPDLLLRDVRNVTRELEARRSNLFAKTAKYLLAADLAASAPGKADLPALAKAKDLDLDGFQAWLDYLGIGTGKAVELTGHFTKKLDKAGGYDFVRGWGTGETPLLLANSSDQPVRIPGNMKPHSVGVHPSPTLQAAVGWRSPVSASLRVEGSVTHAHPECGNGVTWSLELRRGAMRQRLAAGVAQGAKEVPFGPISALAVQPGDLVSLLIGPRDGNHSCDMTAIDVRLIGKDDAHSWNLAADVSSDIQAGNPHADRHGNPDVWHFYTEPDKGGGGLKPIIPAGSLLARWQAASAGDEKQKLADEIQILLTSGQPTRADSADGLLHKQLSSLGGPLLGGLRRALSETARNDAPNQNEPNVEACGLDPSKFGKTPDGRTLGSSSLCVRAPSVVTLRLPADLVEGCELVVTGALEPTSGAEGSVQLEVVAGKPAIGPELMPSEVKVTMANGQWTSDNRRTSYATPIVVNDKSAARSRIEKAFRDFRNLFPAALCYTKIVPVDEVVTLTLFYREDDHLQRLMLDDNQKQRLDRLWDELHFVSRDALTLVDAFAQLLEYASQDADPKVFEPMRKPINERAAAFRKTLVDSEPGQIDALMNFVSQAYRRPATPEELRDLRALYQRLREQEIPHDEAFRLTLARVLVAPAFLYRVETPVPGSGQAPVSDGELANRLSYFLWSSQPDAELRTLATSGRLRETETLLAQTRRMVRDSRTRRLAVEFGCHWIHIADFDRLDEKSEKQFPTFASLRGAMYEESIRFFSDLFQENRSILNILDADYTFLNEPLAKHYGIPFDTKASETEWRRVEGVKAQGRGGILAQATTLATQSGASRTSPTLRGNWISEVLLGERLPKPPKGVPIIPDDEAATNGLTVRQLVEKHSNDANCSVCHRRIDPFGFSLEAYDAIGRRREKDLGDRSIDAHVKAVDGTEFEGLDGLRNYLLTTRRETFVRQFCRKLLGYALGRAVQLSDEPLLDTLQATLKANDYRAGFALETIVLSQQFREIRGRDTAYLD
jgi:hypothetical protein